MEWICDSPSKRGFGAMEKKRRNHKVVLGMVLMISLMIPFLGHSGGRNMENETAVVLRKQDNGKEVQIKSGQVFQIQLEGMGGTGYWWYVQPPDVRHVELISEKTKSQFEGRVGGAVLGLWTFRAKAPGTAEIKMDYYRTWEGVERAAERFRLKVTVE
jgi:predicted secreted protein